MRFSKFTVLALIAISSTAFSADQAKLSPRPPGVQESNWIAITETYGFVITKETGTTTTITGADGVARKYPNGGGTLTGYYMFRRDKYWRRLNAEPNPGHFIPLIHR